MTHLRQQIDAARDAHRAAGYPGDLATEVLSRGEESDPAGVSVARSRLRWVIGAGAALAVAAAVAMMVLLHRPPERGPTEAQVRVETVARMIPPAMPAMPEGMPLVPPHADVSEIPAMPGFPSMLGSL